MGGIGGGIGGGMGGGIGPMGSMGNASNLFGPPAKSGPAVGAGGGI